MSDLQHDVLDDEKPSLTAKIARQVIKALGSPTDLIKVAVHPVGSGRYRANVLVGATAAMAQIAESFFLTADDQGNLTSSSPVIAQRYIHKTHDSPQSQAHSDEIF